MNTEYFLLPYQFREKMLLPESRQLPTISKHYIVYQQSWRPRGQFLKTLALVSRVKSMVSNPPGPRKLACPRSRTAALCFLL